MAKSVTTKWIGETTLDQSTFNELCSRVPHIALFFKKVTRQNEGSDSRPVFAGRITCECDVNLDCFINLFDAIIKGNLHARNASPPRPEQTMQGSFSMEDLIDLMSGDTRRSSSSTPSIPIPIPLQGGDMTTLFGAMSKFMSQPPETKPPAPTPILKPAPSVPSPTPKLDPLDVFRSALEIGIKNMGPVFGLSQSEWEKDPRYKQYSELRF